MMEESVLFKKEIEELREKLNKMMEQKNGRVTPEIIEISQELDKLIDKYHRTNYKKARTEVS